MSEAIAEALPKQHPWHDGGAKLSEHRRDEFGWSQFEDDVNSSSAEDGSYESDASIENFDDARRSESLRSPIDEMSFSSVFRIAARLRQVADACLSNVESPIRRQIRSRSCTWNIRTVLGICR